MYIVQWNQLRLQRPMYCKAASYYYGIQCHAKLILDLRWGPIYDTYAAAVTYFGFLPRSQRSSSYCGTKITGWDSLWTEGGTNYRWSDSPFALNISTHSVEKNILVISSEAKPVSRCNGLSGVKVISGGRSWPLHCAQGSCWVGGAVLVGEF